MRSDDALTGVALGRRIIEQAAPHFPAGMDSPEARLLLLAIGLQESRFKYRHQIAGPARGFWQFEREGGVLGVIRHRTTKSNALKLCDAFGVPFDRFSVYDALAANDLFACCWARLLLWSDPKPLPKLGDTGGAWSYYVRNWRPGKPHPETWEELYDQATVELSRPAEAAA